MRYYVQTQGHGEVTGLRLNTELSRVEAVSNTVRAQVRFGRRRSAQPPARVTITPPGTTP